MGGFWSRETEEDENPALAATGKKRKRKKEGVAVAKLPVRRDPTVLRRTSSMFFDEDGHLAHEFYEEKQVVSANGVVRWAMNRIRSQRLRPQGIVDHKYPRLHVDYPAVIVEVTYAGLSKHR